MALDVLASIEIARPPESVAAYQFDAANDPAWIGGVHRAERLTEGPTSTGSVSVESAASWDDRSSG